MAPPATAAVTPQGVRDGDPLALSGLTERRGAAVLAYSEKVAARGRAVDAAADAFGRFRRAVVDADDPSSIHPERVLLGATRSAAAQRAPRPSSGRLLGRRANAACALVPELLVARAEGTLSDGDRERLDRHLERCTSCREAETRFRAGESAYREAPDDPPDQPAAIEIMRALLAAAPAAGVVANGGAERAEPALAAEAAPQPAEPEPAAPAPEPEPVEPEPAPEPAEPEPTPPQPDPLVEPVPIATPVAVGHADAEERWNEEHAHEPFDPRDVPAVAPDAYDQRTQVLPAVHGPVMLERDHTYEFEPTDEDEPVLPDDPAGADAAPERRGGLLLRVVLPVVVVLTGLAVAVAVAGLFSSTGESNAEEVSPAAAISTPLPTPTVEPDPAPTPRDKSPREPSERIDDEPDEPSTDSEGADAETQGAPVRPSATPAPTPAPTPTPSRAAPIARPQPRPTPAPAEPKPAPRPTPVRPAPATATPGKPTEKAEPPSAAPPSSTPGFKPSP